MTRTSPRALVLFAALASVWVVAFCLPWAVRQALWTDDSYSILTAAHPVSEMIQLMWEYHPARYDHPPLYFLILKPFAALSDSLLVLRLPSLLFLAAASFVLMLDLKGRGASMCAVVMIGLLIVMHPLARHSGICVRMYAQFLFLIVGLFAALWRMPESNRAWYGPETWLAGGLMAALCYTSYFGFVLGLGVAALAMVWILWPVKNGVDPVQRRAGVRLLIAGVFALALLSPWIPAILHLFKTEQTQQETTYSIPRITQFVSTFREFGGGWVGLAWMLLGWVSLMFAGDKRARWAAFLVCFVLLPCALMAVVTPESRLIQGRYLLFSMAMLLTGAVVGWDAAAGKWLGRSRFRVAGTCALLLLPTPFMNYESLNGKLKSVPDWWEAAAIIESQANVGEAILTGGYLSGELLELHMDDPDQHRFIHHVVDLDPFYDACRDPGVVWYVTGSPVPQAYEDILNRYFPFRAEFEGNQGLAPLRVMSKRAFVRTTGDPANFQEPIPLDYE